LAAHERERTDERHGDQRDDQRVLDERLTFLTAEPAVEHVQRTDVCQNHSIPPLLAGFLVGCRLVGLDYLGFTASGRRSLPAKGLVEASLSVRLRRSAARCVSRRRRSSRSTRRTWAFGPWALRRGVLFDRGDGRLRRRAG